MGEKSNFEFLKKDFEIFYEIGKQAETYLYSDGNACMNKIGLLAELLVNLIFELDKLNTFENDTQINKIKILKYEGLINDEIESILHIIRKSRNSASHDYNGDLEKCKSLIEMAHTFCVWFMQIYGDWDYIGEDFFLPENNTQKTIDYEKLLAEQEELIKRLSQQKIVSEPISLVERKKQSNKISNLLNPSEAETRAIIDEQLRKVGWEVDTNTIRYSKGTRPTKGKNLAIAEYPTGRGKKSAGEASFSEGKSTEDSGYSKKGYADYALFVGLKLVGFMEAKRRNEDISSVLDFQVKDYGKNVRDKDKDYVCGTWGEYSVPFLFATNSRKFHKQLETKSGVWFLDTRISTNIPRPLEGYISPQGLIDMLGEDIDKANNDLKATPFDLLTDPNGLNLRKYQLNAIEKTEECVINGKKEILLAMATGTGKTRTILGMIYRFLKSERFKRVLFLVDRTSLGEQAQDVFEEVKIEDLMTVNEIYNIKNLEDKEIDVETKIQIATVQSMVRRVLSNDGDTKPSVSDYDLIIVDEAHRGYILDKEMGEDELTYRNEEDFVSKYRSVINYFEAVKIALTATPAKHTSEIFGKPVFNYSYRQAVIEGYLCDHNTPHIMETEINTKGITYEKGETIAMYDKNTGEITNSDELDDELKFDVDNINKKIVTESFNRTVLNKLSEYIDPTADGKTLIFAVNNDHADLIIKILKEIYSEMGVDNEAIVKITGAIGDKKKVETAIKAFKNERYPNIVVTVDLLTTGIDVPKITNIVFMRRIKSRILFEQMIGRATRRCDDIGKEFFEIYDGVGLYQTPLPDVSSMKPIVTSTSNSFDDLIVGLETFEDKDKIKKQVDMIIAKIQRKKGNLSKETLEQFKSITDGKTPEEFTNYLLNLDPKKAKEDIIKNKVLFDVLNNNVSEKGRYVFVSNKEDKFLGVKRGYGESKKPADYIEEFNNYIKTNLNDNIALNVLCTKPTELTRKELKALRLELDRNNFTALNLNTAYKEMSNIEITADIVSFIRRAALGSPLVSHKERISRAMDKLKKNHNFTAMQANFLKKIESSLLNENSEPILDKETFEMGNFKSEGGFKRFDKVFDNKLEEIIKELNKNLLEDEGATA